MLNMRKFIAHVVTNMLGQQLRQLNDTHIHCCKLWFVKIVICFTVAVILKPIKMVANYIADGVEKADKYFAVQNVPMFFAR